MSKRGLSFDEKKARLLDYMQEHADVYSLKELESSASKAKGIVSQSIKEVLSILCSDGLVDSDKIGSGNFFWALPSKAKMMAVTRIEKAEAELAAAEAKTEELQASLAEAQAQRPTSSTRATDLKRLQQLKSQAAELEGEVGKFADSDPDRLKLLAKGAEVCKAAANRWTDNVQTLLSAIREQRPDVEEEQMLENYGLPKNFDYLE